jgi:hypothetical protein
VRPAAGPVLLPGARPGAYPAGPPGRLREPYLLPLRVQADLPGDHAFAASVLYRGRGAGPGPACPRPLRTGEACKVAVAPGPLHVQLVLEDGDFGGADLPGAGDYHVVRRSPWGWFAAGTLGAVGTVAGMAGAAATASGRGWMITGAVAGAVLASVGFGYGASVAAHPWSLEALAEDAPRLPVP